MAFDLALVLNLVTTLSILAGVAFAMVQIQQTERKRREEATITILQTFQEPGKTQAVARLIEMNPGFTRDEAREAGTLADAHLLANEMESLGMLVHMRVVDLRTIARFWPMHAWWRRMERFVLDSRAFKGEPDLWCWFEWLAAECAKVPGEHPPGWSPRPLPQADPAVPPP